MTEGEGGRVRLDKWLWAARFFKTRSLAAAAVEAGHVEVNEVGAKPARGVKVGDTLRIRRGAVEQVVVVKGVSDRRGPAEVARQLYEETEESRVRRESEAESRRLVGHAAPAGRPDKRERRRIIRFLDEGE